jgi:hypothetical protein
MALSPGLILSARSRIAACLSARDVPHTLVIVRCIETPFHWLLSAHVNRRQLSYVRSGCVLVHQSGCLGTAVAFQAAEVERRDAMLAESAFEGEATIQWFCCVMSHGFLLGNSYCAMLCKRMQVNRAQHQSDHSSLATITRPKHLSPGAVEVLRSLSLTPTRQQLLFEGARRNCGNRTLRRVSAGGGASLHLMTCQSANWTVGTPKRN